ncbi:MAG: YlmH/Sll1252 family protein [Paenibacillaceae bacterium]
MMNKQLYMHFHADEHHFVDKAWEWISQASELHRVKRTDFLDPRQAGIVTALVQRTDNVRVHFDGGYKGAERQRALIAPDYRTVIEDMGIEVLSIIGGDSKFLTLTHGDFMGAILGLGMKRDKIGDIHVHESGCHCLVAEEASSYLRLQLHQVHKVAVQTEIIPLAQFQPAKVDLEELHISVASLRMDGIVSDAFRLSRAKILLPIKSGKCRVNWKVEEDPSKQLHEGDLISVQGLGRFKVLEVEGMSKKGRIRMKIGRFK